MPLKTDLLALLSDGVSENTPHPVRVVETTGVYPASTPENQKATPSELEPSLSSTCGASDRVDRVFLRRRRKEEEGGYDDVSVQQVCGTPIPATGLKTCLDPVRPSDSPQGVAADVFTLPADPVIEKTTPSDPVREVIQTGQVWFYPGDILPPEIVAMIALDPWTDDVWWENEDFVLQAAAIGIRSRPKRPDPIRVDPAEEANAAAWDKIAYQFMGMKDREFRLNDSEIESWWIGFRGYANRSHNCRMAYNRLEARKVMEGEEAAEKKRRAKEGVPDQSASPKESTPKKGRKK